MRLPVTPAWEGLWSFAYPITPPERSEQRSNHELRVLALGLPRSGTDSLRAALTILGYNNVYHGYIIPFLQSSDPALWCPLMQRKFAGDFTAARLDAGELRREFDRIIGNSEAVTDVPCVVFAEELMKAYPDAMVIINRRELSSWHASMKKTAMAPFTWLLFILHFFDAEFFWVYRVFELGLVVWTNREFDQRGKEFAAAHYRTLEQLCKTQQRQYLDWTVEEGWVPLCKYLGHDVPQEDFPWENKAGTAFEKKVEAALRVMVPRAMRNLGMVFLAFLALAGALWWQLRQS